MEVVTRSDGRAGSPDNLRAILNMNQTLVLAGQAARAALGGEPVKPDEVVRALRSNAFGDEWQAEHGGLAFDLIGDYWAERCWLLVGIPGAEGPDYLIRRAQEELHAMLHGAPNTGYWVEFTED